MADFKLIVCILTLYGAHEYLQLALITVETHLGRYSLGLCYPLLHYLMVNQYTEYAHMSYKH